MTERLSMTPVEIQERQVLSAVNGNSMPKPEIPSNTAIIPQELINVLADNNTFLNLLKDLEIYDIHITRAILRTIVKGNLNFKKKQTIFNSDEFLGLFSEDWDYSTKLSKVKMGIHRSTKVLNRFGLDIETITETEVRDGKARGFYLYTLKKQEKPVEKPITNGKTVEAPEDVRSLTISDIARQNSIKLSKVQRIAYAIRDTSNPDFGRLEENLKGGERYIYSEAEAKQIIERVKASKGVSDIPVEESTVKSPLPQPEPNGKTPEGKSPEGESKKRTLTHEDIAKMCGRNKNAVQDIANTMRKTTDPGLGKRGKSSKGGKCIYYSQNEAERIIEMLENTPANGKDREKRERRERGEARIDQASQLERVSADFTDAILNYLAMSSPYANPLDSLDRDLSLSSFLIYSSNGSRRSIEELKEKYTTKQIETFIVSSFIKKVEEMLNDKNAIQKHSVESPLRISQARRAVNKYGGIENLTMAIVERFFVPLSRKQIAFTLHPLRSANSQKV